MTDRRMINRRSQAMHYKGVYENPAIPEEEDEEDEDDHEKAKLNKAFITKSKDATVEVTVKVKKRRDKSGESGKKSIPLREQEFRKGSWGDLLSASRTSLACKDKDIKTDRRSKEVVQRRSSPGGRAGEGDGKRSKKKDDHDHSPLCQRIPITDDLYLETHTHIRKSQSADTAIKSAATKAKASTMLRQRALVRENEDLRDQVDRLLREIEVTKSRPRHVRSVSRGRGTPVYADRDQDQEAESESIEKKKSKGSTQSTQTSRACLTSTSPKKKTSQSQTQSANVDVVDLRSPPKRSTGIVTVSSSSTTTAPAFSTENAEAQLENLRLEKENEALRVEAGKLVEDMTIARREYLECCNTMKELHNIAEILKRDNFNLLQKYQHQQTLEGKLIQALSENREMKEVLETVVGKQKSTDGIQDEQLAQIRNVIKDVKMTIAQEMQGLTVQPSSNSAFLVEKDNVDSDIGFRIGESFLNDTNASEIQRILGEPPEIRLGNNQEDRSSSTQYLTLGGLSSMNGNFRPSPLTVSRYSPRVSTPNSSNVSLNLSEAGGGSFVPVYPIAVNPSKSKEDNEWKRLEEEVARSFVPVRNELSNCSTSSYSSSTSSSPNPIRKP